VGGLAPILKAMLTPDTLRRMPFELGDAGYLLIALAGGCVALDRFFGYSSGRIRYTTTALALEKSLDEFRLEWAAILRSFAASLPNERELDQLIVTCETSVWRSVVRWSRRPGRGSWSFRMSLPIWSRTFKRRQTKRKRSKGEGCKSKLKSVSHVAVFVGHP
jgi:hypothetical protein